MFRKRDQQAALRPDPVRPEELGVLYPFTGLADDDLQALLACAVPESLPPGPLPAPMLTGDHLVYLLRGSVRIRVDGRLSRVVAAGSASARFRLPSGMGRAIAVLEPSVLVRIPRRLAPPGEHFAVPLLALGGAEKRATKALSDHFHGGNCELPSLPDLALRIAHAIDDPNTRNEDIARLMRADPALAARVLSVVNSAAFRAGQRIASLDQAVARLGRRRVRNLVVSCLLKGLFETDSTVLRQRMQELWQHSSQVAALSMVLARVTPGLDPDRALLAGLVHDIGEVAILSAARGFPAMAENAALLDAVTAAMRAEVGVLVLRRWGLAADLMEVAARAEDWQRAGTMLPDNVDVVILAQLHAAIGSPRMHRLPRIDQIPAFHKLALGELSPRQSIALLDRAETEVREVRQLLAGR